MQPPASDNLPTTPHKLTAALHDSGALRKGVVTDLAITGRIDTTVSNLWFLAVGYSSDLSPMLPNRLLVKRPLVTSPAAAAEPAFYRDLAPQLSSPPIVRCLATGPGADGRQWLLLEDLRSTHTHPPWPQRPSDAAVKAAVSVLARLHAHWWEAPTLGSAVGTFPTEAGLRAMVHGIAGRLPAFVDDPGASLSASDRSVLEAVFNSSLDPWLRLVDRRALTLTHGDAQTSNFLFPRSGQGDPYLIDWQLWHLDIGARDLAFMITLHWDRTVRQSLELPLLQLYHRQIVSEGIDNYSFDDLWLDYRRSAVRNLTIPITLWARGLAPKAWRDRLDCALAAYRDLGGDEVL